jgi:hypothetical protein
LTFQIFDDDLKVDKRRDLPEKEKRGDYTSSTPQRFSYTSTISRTPSQQPQYQTQSTYNSRHAYSSASPSWGHQSHKLGDLRSNLEMSIKMLEEEEVEQTYDVRQMESGLNTTHRLEQSLVHDQQLDELQKTNSQFHNTLDEFKKKLYIEKEMRELVGNNEEPRDRKLVHDLETSKRKIEKDLADSKRKVSLLKNTGGSNLM